MFVSTMTFHRKHRLVLLLYWGPVCTGENATRMEDSWRKSGYKRADLRGLSPTLLPEVRDEIKHDSRQSQTMIIHQLPSHQDGSRPQYREACRGEHMVRLYLSSTAS